MIQTRGRGQSMRFFSLVPVILVVFGVWGACLQKEKPGDFDSLIRKLSKTKTLKEWRNVYTEETIRAIDSALNSGIIEKGTELNYLLPMGDSIEYISETISRDKDSVHLRLTIEKHPRENMRGANLEVQLELENGEWKFNLSDEIRRGLKNRGAP